MAATPLNISIVIPIYQGERVIEELVDEISLLFKLSTTPNGHSFVVPEVLLVHDCGPDYSDLAIRRLSDKYHQIKPIWLTKNFGQHAATLAGMSSASGEWIITMDEDGQHDPSYIGSLLDHALSLGMQVVYAKPTNNPPHGFIRNLMSRMAKRVCSLLMGNKQFDHFNSFRILRGDIARSLAAYCGHGVYLDVGLLWITERIGCCPVLLRATDRRVSGYTYTSLIGHFWSMLLTSGTRPLRLITLLGFFSISIAFLLSLTALYSKLTSSVEVQGWASLVIIVSFFAGCILISLGMIAEYLAVSMGIAMGKPLYVIGIRSSRSS